MAQRFGELVRAARTSQDLTLADLLARSRISKPYLSQIETGNAPPPEDAKVRLLEQGLGFEPGRLLLVAHLERAPVDVLAYIEQLRAENRKLRQMQLMGRQVARFGEAGRQAELPPQAPDEDPMTALGPLIPLISERYRHGEDGLRGEALDFPAGAADEHIRCPGIEDFSAFAVCVYGDRMADAFRAGDLVIVTEAGRIEAGGAYLVRLADGPSVLRCVYDDGPAGLRLQPANPAYRPRYVSRAQIRAQYRTLATIRWSGPPQAGETPKKME